MVVFRIAVDTAQAIHTGGQGHGPAEMGRRIA
jgi:hypothetical protein